MNGDMPHVPITTLAGIASLTDLLNQLPLPSPLPATTTKSLLFGGRIAEDVNCLLGCRDESLVTQLVHSLSQVSTDHIELKDNLGSDDPEGDIPVLLQAVLARNPNVFREKSLQNRYGQILPHQQYKLPQNSIHGSPASSTFQQSTISHSPSSRFVPPPSSSSTRYLPQQNSPVPSPYAPQSPAGYMQYQQHPPSYTQHQQIQQASVSSPLIPSGMRNIHDSKVASQMSSSSSNHHTDNSRHGSTEDYMHMVHRLGSEDGDSSLRNTASFPLRSPQAVCSPASSDGTPKASRPPLILQSPPPYASPRDAPPDILLDSPDRMGSKKKTKKAKLTKEEKEQADKTAMYDIVSSPSKGCTKLTLRLTRVRDQQDDLIPNMDGNTENEAELNNMQFSEQTAKQPGTPNDNHDSMNIAAQCEPQQEQAFLQAQQVPVLQQNTAAGAVKPTQSQQQQQEQSMTPYNEVELDALAEIERIERESAMERERFSKEVQDKDKPLKKRKQDSFPQETAGAGGGANRPALLVSIDLHHAGRTDAQAALPPDPECVKKPSELVVQSTEEPSNLQQEAMTGVLKPKPENRLEIPRRKSETEGQKNDSRPDVIKARPDTPKQRSESQGDAAKVKHDNRRDSAKPLSDKRPEIVKQKHESKSEHSKVKAENRSDMAKVRHEGRPVSEATREKREHVHEAQKPRAEDKSDAEKLKIDPSKIKRPETPKLSKGESDFKSARNENVKHSSRIDGSKPVKVEKRIRSESGERGERVDRSDRKSDLPSGSLSSKEKDERRSEGSRVRPDIHKPPIDSKDKFPSYLLGGGRSEALKNFVIPKIKRDKDGNVSSEQREPRKPLDKNELKVKAEKLDLVEDLKKGIKPVVVLHKLPLDEVQKFIKDSEDKNALRGSSRSSKSRPPSKPSKGGIDQSVLKELPPDLVAEIESTMPLCERVKMIKRKRSTVKEKPNYAEISSDEGDNDSEQDFESSRKRHKKDKEVDKAWECEDRDRRVLNELRKSSHSHDGRRSSGSSRYREKSPESEEGSPPPSLSEIAKKMRKREKQKKRKAYEPKLTPEEMMDSSTFKRFTGTVENILENLEDMDFTALGDEDEVPQELLLGKQQLNELSSESAKIKAMGIMDRLPTDKMVKVLSILEKNIQDGAKLSTLFNHVSFQMCCQRVDLPSRIWLKLVLPTSPVESCSSVVRALALQVRDRSSIPGGQGQTSGKFPYSTQSLIIILQNKTIINWSFSIHDCLWDIAVRNWLPRSPTNIQSIHFTVCSVKRFGTSSRREQRYIKCKDYYYY
uniref:NIPBL cohesin loading factor n=1 Tax=Callorhinchus milii TaxID=7868 RepID=A0A4W3INF4_CALMI